LLSSKKFGGSVLVKRIEGKKNPLKERIEGDAAAFMPRFKKAVSVEGEKFYNLENIQIRKGFPDFIDA
jgi:hypothetical protein